MANDTCGGAVPVNCQTDIDVDGSEATINGSLGRGCSTNGPGLWYFFEGDGQSWEITATPQSADIEIQMFSGACNDLTCVSEASDAALAETLTIPTVLGTSYLMYIAGADGTVTSIDDFNLKIVCSTLVPANDTCGGAIELSIGENGSCGEGEGIISTTTLGASRSIQSVCSQNNNFDLWYTFTATSEELSFNSITGAPGLSVFAGDCNALGASIGCVNNTSGVISGLTIGNSYNALVWTTQAEILVEFCIEEFVPPATDLCSGAIALTCDNTVFGTTVGATINTNLDNCGTSVTTASGVWYSFIGNGGDVTFSLCNDTTSYNTKLAVYQGTCDSLVCVGGNDNACGTASEVEINSIESTNYYIYVTGLNDEAGYFGLSVISASSRDTIIINTGSCNPDNAGTESVVLTNSSGCDSVVTTITNLVTSFNDTIYLTSCIAEGVEEVIDSNLSVDGCDSITVIITSLLPTAAATIQLTTCDPDETGIAIDTLLGSNGCDSIVTSITSLVSSYNDTIYLTTCFLLMTGEVVDSTISTEGCDSVTVTITTLPSSAISTTQLTTCTSNEVETVVDTLVGSDGCDSLHLTITILLLEVETTNQLYTCNPNEIGSVIDTFVAANGCDSLVTTITSLLSDTIFINQVYTCNSDDITSATDTFTSSQGCDSIVFTTISLLPEVTITNQSFTCDVNEVGSSIDTLTASNGCDSIVVTLTSLLSETSFTNYLFTCDANEVGTSTDTLVASAGCDSVVMTITNLLSDTTFTNQLYTCNINDLGTTIDTLESSDGCDSISITITVLEESDYTTINTTSCNPNDVGIETIILSNSTGCDSVVTTITAYGDYFESNVIYVCDESAEGIVIDTFSHTAGCDSIVETNYVYFGVTASFDFIQVDSSIQFFNDSENADEYLWDFGDGETSTINNPNHEYQVSGGYGVHLIASNEYCSDSIFKSIEINLPTSIGLSSLIESIVLYPNPNDGTFEVELKSSHYTAQLELTLWNLAGKKIDGRQVNFNGYTKEMYSFSELTAGSYFLQIQDGENQLVLRVDIVK